MLLVPLFFLAYSGEHLLSMAVLTSVSKVDTILIHFVGKEMC